MKSVKYVPIVVVIRLLAAAKVITSLATSGVCCAAIAPAAAAIMLPCLVFVGDVIGIFGGYAVSVKALGFAPIPYINNTWDYLEWFDVTSGMMKAAVFGFLVALMGCYHGYHSKGGAQGVGAATTNAVVSASILILLSNYLLTELFFGDFTAFKADEKAHFEAILEEFSGTVDARIEVARGNEWGQAELFDAVSTSVGLACFLLLFL